MKSETNTTPKQVLKCSKCQEHPVHCKGLCKKCYDGIWRSQHRQQIREADAKRRLTSEVKAYRKQWYEQHKGQIRQWKKEYYHRRKEIDKKYYITTLIRAHIHNVISRRSKFKTTQSPKTEQLLGCTITEFMDYITSLFQPGMSWDNYGQWHLDHIKPLAIAQSEQEIYDLCHYTNYQPLWAFDNLSKGSKYKEEN